jgi:hypothetical protein
MSAYDCKKCKILNYHKLIDPSKEFKSDKLRELSSS